MYLGIHLSTFTPNWEDPILPYLEAVKTMGFDMVEIPLMSPFSFEWKSVKEELSRLGLFCTCGTSMNPLEDISSMDPERRQAGEVRLRQCIDLCNALESDTLGGVLYAPWGIHIPREAFMDNRKSAIEVLKRVSPYAREKGVTLSLEILNRYESSVINTVQEGLFFINEIQDDGVKLHFDTFHAHIEEKSLSEAIRAGGHSIKHVHLCDNNRAAPGTGTIDFDQVLEDLKSIGYDGNLVIENFVLPGTPAGNEVCVWSSVYDSPLKNAQYGYQYISKLMIEKGIRNA